MYRVDDKQCGSWTADYIMMKPADWDLHFSKVGIEIWKCLVELSMIFNISRVGLVERHNTGWIGLIRKHVRKWWRLFEWRSVCIPSTLEPALSGCLLGDKSDRPLPRETTNSGMYEIKLGHGDDEMSTCQNVGPKLHVII